MSDWQRRRKQAHTEGRHRTPQIDCQYCWNAGHFKAWDNTVEPADDPPQPVPVHWGQHPGCLVCEAMA